MSWETLNIPDPKDRAQRKWEIACKLARYRGDPLPPSPEEVARLRLLAEIQADVTPKDAGVDHGRGIVYSPPRDSAPRTTPSIESRKDNVGQF